MQSDVTASTIWHEWHPKEEWCPCDEGDVDGALVWRRILEAIDELRRERREREPLY